MTSCFCVIALASTVVRLEVRYIFWSEAKSVGGITLLVNSSSGNGGSSLISL